ncbi:Hypothetical predicted protein [Paramuricea clavata]|uniref:Uncharacterized protein n=1 Tax=Paramuricea clavata TaxID=317549 RepID=A0A7D9LSE5_PARCT|nr:Hypothetical predicted protein [Paramuricea clavata]
MAAEWDNLIPDSRDMPSKNDSFHEDFEDNSDRKMESKKPSKSRKKKTYSSTSEQSLLSEDQDEYSVTEYVMEYTDIFEPSTQQKLDFVDIQEGDRISEASDDEIVAHSSEAKTYEHTDILDSEESEDSSRLPPVDTGVDTFGIDVDLGMNNGIADESEENDEALVMDNEGHNTSSKNIETNLGNLVEIEGNGKRENKQVDAQVKVENEQVEVPKVKSEHKQVEKVKHESKQMEVPKVKSENKQVEKMKSENRQMEAQKVDEVIEQGSEGGEKEESGKEDEKESDDEQSEEQVEILAEDDYSDDTTEVDKLIQDNNTKVENKIYQKKTKSKMVSSGTQAREAEPLLNTSQTPSPPETPSPSQTPSPEPQESSRHRKQFTPREYPGKAVKSIAIGTDDDYPSNEYTKERHARASPAESQKRGKGSTGKVRPRQNNENGVKTPKKASTPTSTRTQTSTRTPTSSRSHRQANGDTPTPRSKQLRGERGSQSSDAMFFKSRLSQTSKRHPKRHVWLVRDSEIHRLIAEKAAILRRFKEEGITGRVKSKGFPNYSEVDVLGLPSVGFSGRTKDDSHRSSLPYDRHPSSRSSQGGYHGGLSSEDEDERTNRLGTKGGKGFMKQKLFLLFLTVT